MPIFAVENFFCNYIYRWLITKNTNYFKMFLKKVLNVEELTLAGFCIFLVVSTKLLSQHNLLTLN